MTASFGIRFFSSNIMITILIIAILLIKKCFKNHLSHRMQYNIWFLFLIMLIIPFLPLHSIRLGQVYTNALYSISPSISSGISSTPSITSNWMQDFSLSVERETPSHTITILLVIWLIGIAVMTGLTVHSNLKLKQLIHSALPVQNQSVRMLFKECMQNVNIKKNISIYSSAFLKSPISIGLFRPCIILPISFISDYHEKDMRFILLHELQHYRHKDIAINYIMCFFKIIYWFHPMVWLALKEMRNDREIACDTSVLYMLDEESYVDYGKTLIHFAEKLSHGPLSQATGIGGTKKQIQKRIMNIASFQRESKWIKLKSILVFILSGSLVLLCTPILSLNVTADNHYNFSTPNVSYEDLSPYFEDYDGSFVLYNMSRNQWSIYNKSNSTKRISPVSTYKIYSALFGLESGSISPSSSDMQWNRTSYSFDAWNKDQDLESAMKNSVNWYFQELDKKTGMPALQQYITQIGYGNMDLSGGISKSWMQSTLKISPVEQVELLTKLYKNEFDFNKNNIQAVKQAMLLSSSNSAALYGKTGTGTVEEKTINGWLIGFIEKDNETYIYATNIQGKDNANGSKASEITLEILKAKQLY